MQRFDTRDTENSYIWLNDLIMYISLNFKDINDNYSILQTLDTDNTCIQGRL